MYERELQLYLMEGFHNELYDEQMHFRVLGMYLSMGCPCLHTCPPELIIVNDDKECLSIYTSHDLLEDKIKDNVAMTSMKDVIKLAVMLGTDGLCLNKDVVFTISDLTRLVIEAKRREEIAKIAAESNALKETGIYLAFDEDYLDEIPRDSLLHKNLLISNICFSEESEEMLKKPAKLVWILLKEFSLSYYDLKHLQIALLEKYESIDIYEKKMMIDEIKKQRRKIEDNILHDFVREE